MATLFLCLRCNSGDSTRIGKIFLPFIHHSPSCSLFRRFSSLNSSTFWWTSGIQISSVVFGHRLSSLSIGSWSSLQVIDFHRINSHISPIAYSMLYNNDQCINLCIDLEHHYIGLLGRLNHFWYYLYFKPFHLCSNIIMFNTTSSDFIDCSHAIDSNI